MKWKNSKLFKIILAVLAIVFIVDLYLLFDELFRIYDSFLFPYHFFEWTCIIILFISLFQSSNRFKILYIFSSITFLGTAFIIIQYSSLVFAEYGSANMDESIRFELIGDLLKLLRLKAYLVIVFVLLNLIVVFQKLFQKE